MIKKRYLNLASDAYQLYKVVLPEPKAEDYYQEITAFKVITSRIKEVIEEEIDVSQVKKDLEDLLDRLNPLISEYNSGSRDLDLFFEELIVLAKELSEEDTRAIKENLTEEDCKNRAQKTYFHIYDSYVNAEINVYT